MIGLTHRQTELLQFIRSYSAAHHLSPTLNEIAMAMGWRSKAIAFAAVSALVQRGWLVRTGAGSRNIALVHQDKHDSICDCEGCSRARQRFHETIIAALQHKAPASLARKMARIKPLDNVARLRWIKPDCITRTDAHAKNLRFPAIRGEQ